jgi:hypothetical protein
MGELCLVSTDRRRPADAVVVRGCRAGRSVSVAETLVVRLLDGRPSCCVRVADALSYLLQPSHRQVLFFLYAAGVLGGAGAGAPRIGDLRFLAGLSGRLDGAFRKAGRARARLDRRNIRPSCRACR